MSAKIRRFPSKSEWRLRLEIKLSARARGFESHPLRHVGAKSALLRRSFIPAEQKNVIRPLPYSSFPNRTRCAGLRFGLGNENIQIGASCQLIVRSFCCSSLPNRIRCAAVGGFAALRMRRTPCGCFAGFRFGLGNENIRNRTSCQKKETGRACLLLLALNRFTCG